MADVRADESLGIAEDHFEDLDLDGMSAVINADHAKVPSLRKQAKAYRELVQLVERHRSGFSRHIEDALGSWSSKGTSGVRSETSDIDDSIRRSLQSMSGNADGLDRIADEVVAAKTTVDRIRAEWADLEAQYQANPHILDGYSVDGTPDYQAAKASYTQEARDRMHGLSVETTQAWYTDMHEPGTYTGPTYGKEPERTVTPSRGSSTGGGSGEGYTFTDGSSGTSQPSGSAGTGASTGNPSPATNPGPVYTPPSGSPHVEFPTPVASPPVGTPPIVGGPIPGTPPGSGFPVGGTPIPPAVPGYGSRPGVFGAPRPILGGTGSVPPPRPGTGTGMPSGRTSPSVIGQRAGTTSKPGTRGAAKPAMPEKGVIRNPRQNAAAQATPAKNTKRREDKDDGLYGDGPETDELFEGLNLHAAPEVIRPEPQAPRVQRKDAGPIYPHRRPRA